MKQPEWVKGPGRAPRWQHGLPFPAHRTWAEVMADELALQRARERLASERGQRLRKEEQNGCPRPPKL